MLTNTCSTWTMASSLIGSHGMALVTAMALSGTVILMAICRSRPLSSTSSAAGFVDPRPCTLRSCISSAEKRRDEKQKKKRVRFAENVIVEFDAESSSGSETEVEEEYAMVAPEIVHVHCDSNRDNDMPANRAALYNGILQYRRMTCY